MATSSEPPFIEIPRPMMALLDFGVRKRLAMRSVSQPFVLPVSTKYSPNFICFRRSLKPATFSCSYKQLCAADKRASEQEKEGHERVSVYEPFACAFLPSFFFPTICDGGETSRIHRRQGPIKREVPANKTICIHAYAHTHTNIDHVCLCAHGGCQRCRKQLLK